jgi:hypothetical protein
MYENMSYESSSSTANFYIQDAVTGDVIDSCSISAPTGRDFDGNTADYEVEIAGPQELQFNVSTVSFSDAHLEWGSDGD